MDKKRSRQYKHYRDECKAVGGNQYEVALERVAADAQSVNLLYRWHEALSPDEADRLDSRLRAYIACAVYNAARKGGLGCIKGPPHGRRPSWIIEGERAPYGLQNAGFDVGQKLCWLQVGPIMMSLRAEGDSSYVLETLMKSFRYHFSKLKV